MAITARFSNGIGYYQHYYGVLNYQENSYNVENNTSNITLWVDMYADDSRYNFYGYNNTGHIYVNGNEYANDSSSATVNSSGVRLVTWTGNVGHNDDGSLNLTVGFSIDSGYAGHCENSTGWQLTTIPRASQPSATSGNIEENIVIYTNRKSSSFTHTLTYSFGSLSGTIATGVGDSTTWTLPSTFYAQIPNAKSGTGTITCTTYNGSTQIGSAKTCSFTAYASETRCKPTITLNVTDMNSTCTNLTGSNKKLIKFFSTPAVTLTATRKNSATIKTTSILCGDGKSASSTSSFTYTFYEVESAYFKGNVTDSRGYQNSVEATGLTIVNYIKLTLNPVELYRPVQTGSQIKIKGSGNYFNGNFGSTNNTLTFKYRYREYGSSTWGSYTTVTPTISNNTYSFDVLVGNSFDYRKQYEFQFVANDKLMSTTLEEVSKPGIPLMWLGKNYMEFDGKKGFDWEDDNLTIDDDIYLGTTGIQVSEIQPTITVDANGWTVIDHQFYKEYLKKGNFNYTIPGALWRTVHLENLPEGMQTIEDVYLTSSVYPSDGAVSCAVGAGYNYADIGIQMYNVYGLELTVDFHYSLRIIELPNE